MRPTKEERLKRLKGLVEQQITEKEREKEIKYAVAKFEMPKKGTGSKLFELNQKIAAMIANNPMYEYDVGKLAERLIDESVELIASKEGATLPIDVVYHRENGRHLQEHPDFAEGFPSLHGLYEEMEEQLAHSDTTAPHPSATTKRFFRNLKNWLTTDLINGKKPENQQPRDKNEQKAMQAAHLALSLLVDGEIPFKKLIEKRKKYCAPGNIKGA